MKWLRKLIRNEIEIWWKEITVNDALTEKASTKVKAVNSANAIWKFMAEQNQDKDLVPTKGPLAGLNQTIREGRDRGVE